MMRKKAEDITGQKKVYVANITARVHNMLKRAEFVKAQGGRVAMMDIVTVGFSGVQHIRDQNFGLILHGHRAMHGAFTHSSRHGIAMLPLAKIARLAGIDQLHTGTVIGKMRGGAEEVSEINHCMRRQWHDIKPTLPIASGGVHPGLVPEMVRLIGKDVIINMGGGIHGHPDGTRSGAMAARQAVEASMKNVDLQMYARENHELARALEKWGVYEGKKERSLITYVYGMHA
jgi:ribulose-bisphosphate carboxylase large chain